MSEIQSALPGASFDGLITIRELGPRGMITVRGDLSDATLKKAVTAAAGLAFPEQRAVQCDRDRGLLWMATDELMVLAPYAEARGDADRIGKALAGQHALVADVSDARAVFRLEGEAIRDVLAKLTPADMSAASLPPGQLRRTRLAQVPAAFAVTPKGASQCDCANGAVRMPTR